MNREEEYNKERDAFVKKMLEENLVAENLKEAAIGYWERIFSEGCSSTTEEEKVQAKKNHELLDRYHELKQKYGKEEAQRIIENEL